MMGYQGWAIFMDCDMLNRGDIAEFWAQRDDSFAQHCVQHDHQPSESQKFLGETQRACFKKNWSSLMLPNCSPAPPSPPMTSTRHPGSTCTALTGSAATMRSVPSRAAGTIW